VQTNTEDTVECAGEAEAKAFFATVSERLFQPHLWHGLAGSATATFALTDAAGNERTGRPSEGDHFRIDIPGPGPATGDGYDWVRVEAVEEQHDEAKDCVIVRVRPATNPLNDKTDVAHFFSDEATSNFMVKREGNKVTAGVYGRNEKPNMKAEAVTDKLRNVTVGAGAISGFSKIQWKSLVTGLLKREL
jgi:hypothetical protein